MKTVWRQRHLLKTDRKIYTCTIRKFLRWYKGNSPNKIKFAFDRIIETMHELPGDVFDTPKGRSASENDLQSIYIFSIPGIQNVYSLHHELASETKMYCELQGLAGRILCEEEKRRVIRFCGLVSDPRLYH